MIGDHEKGEVFTGTEFMFSEKTVRNAFVRKVYSILSLQMLVTTGIIALFMVSPGAKEYVRGPQGVWLVGVSFAGVMMFLLVLACAEKVRRQWPANILCLMGFTLFESLSLGVLTCQYDTEIVLIAAALTALITFGLTLYALQSKYDFTAMGGTLMVCLFALLGFGILAMFIPGKTIQIAYSSAGAVLFGIYLIFDTQIMLGGKHKYALSPEEYIFAALNLYLDIINLFIYILSILAESRK